MAMLMSGILLAGTVAWIAPRFEGAGEGSAPASGPPLSCKPPADKAQAGAELPGGGWAMLVNETSDFRAADLAGDAIQVARRAKWGSQVRPHTLQAPLTNPDVDLILQVGELERFHLFENGLDSSHLCLVSAMQVQVHAWKL